ncbi:hypothetical protein [Pedobacter sp. MR22-3]|nr:hypothetical protein [Pedobacter sp. MR22-3]MCX2584647.1 hypothetical protein [Pedobacter sp. MR22-3]
MENLSYDEMIEIKAGSKEKERSTFDSAVNAIGGAILGTVGLIASWFD